MIDETTSEGVYGFGCTKIDNHPAWLVQNASETTSAQEANALDENGEIKIAHFYQKQVEMSLEVIVPKADKELLPKVGTKFTYKGVGWYVSGATQTETNTDFNRFSITAKRYLDKDGNPSMPDDASESL